MSRQYPYPADRYHQGPAPGRPYDHGSPYDRGNPDPMHGRRVEDPYDRRNEDPLKRKEDQYSKRKDDSSRRPDHSRDDHYVKSHEEQQHGRILKDGYEVRKPTVDGFHSDSYKPPMEPVGFDPRGRPDPVIYEVDHLVTFDVSPKQGVKNHTDGLERLNHMQMTSGVWTMRHLMSVDDKEVMVTEKATRRELESFPISRITDPVNIISDNPKEIYNNIVIFIVQSDNPKVPAEMHVFQCIGKPGQDLIDDIEAARNGKFPRRPKPINQDRKHSTQPEDNQKPMNGGVPPPRFRTIPNSTTDVDIETLNRCFDDIESFIDNLQAVANAQKELELSRSSGNMDPAALHFGILQSLIEKSKPPPAREFVDTFQKFKLALNLLPKLKHLVKDPTAQELTHMLFAPLGLIVEASRDAKSQLPKLAASVTSPLLNHDTCVLLDTCLHSNEIKLWRSLGDAWNVPLEYWKGPPPAPYIPRFEDHSKPAKPQPQPTHNLQQNGMKPHDEGASTISNGGGGAAAAAAAHRVSSVTGSGKEPLPAAINTQEEFLRSLRDSKAKIGKVLQARESKNPTKELTVVQGEYVHVLDDAKNWWKVSNISKQQGYVPKTILVPV